MRHVRYAANAERCIASLSARWSAGCSGMAAASRTPCNPTSTVARHSPPAAATPTPAPRSSRQSPSMRIAPRRITAAVSRGATRSNSRPPPRATGMRSRSSPATSKRTTISASCCKWKTNRTRRASVIAAPSNSIRISASRTSISAACAKSSATARKPRAATAKPSPPASILKPSVICLAPPKASPPAARRRPTRVPCSTILRRISITDWSTISAIGFRRYWPPA